MKKILIMLLDKISISKLITLDSYHAEQIRALVDSSCGDLNKPLEMLNNLRKTIRFEGKAILIKGVINASDSKQFSKKLILEFGKAIGQPVSQSARNDFVGEVADFGENTSSNNARGYRSSDKLKYHNDRCDIVALLCYESAYSGGETKLVYTPDLYKELKAISPHLLEVASQPFPQDLRDTKKDSWCEIPIFSMHEGELITRYIKRFIMASQRFQSAPILSNKQLLVMDEIDKILMSNKITTQILLNKGDLLIFNNHKFLHARSSFVDKGDQKRLLLRLWLSHKDSEELPHTFKALYNKIHAGELRGGVWADK